MLASLMFKTKVLLDEFEDFVSAEVLRLLHVDETAFNAQGMTIDYDHEAARFIVGNCTPYFAVNAAARKAIWGLGFESFVLESANRKLEYSAAADRLAEGEAERAEGAAAGT